VASLVAPFYFCIDNYQFNEDMTEEDLMAKYYIAFKNAA
jgi:hypothetical protein